MIGALVAGVTCAVLFLFVFLPWLHIRKQKQRAFENELGKSMAEEMRIDMQPQNPQLAAALGTGPLQPPMPPYRAGKNPFGRGQPPRPPPRSSARR